MKYTCVKKLKIKMSFPINLISVKTCAFLAFSSRFIQLISEPNLFSITDAVMVSCLVYMFYYNSNTLKNNETKDKEKQITQALSMLTKQLNDVLKEAENKESEVKRKIEFFENKQFLKEECGKNITEELDHEFKDLAWLNEDDISPFNPDN